MQGPLSALRRAWAVTLIWSRALQQVLLDAWRIRFGWWRCSELDRFPVQMPLRRTALRLREAAYLAPRLFKCALCRRETTIDRECDRGNRYCSEGCAAVVRREQVRQAGRRYQLSEQGRLRHQERQRQYRQRRIQAESAVGAAVAVPEVLLPVALSNQIDGRIDSLCQAGGPTLPGDRRCNFCGAECSAFSRLDSLRSRKWRFRPAFGSMRTSKRRIRR